MSDTVKEFMEKPVKKYACGEKAQQAQKTLQNTFTASSAKSAADEKRLLSDVLETLNKTDSGRETLETLSDLGYKIKFQNLGKQFGGYCNYDDRVIVLNPTRSKNFLAVAVVHEGRHGIQFASEKKNAPIFEQTRVADMYRMRKAIEADACAHQAAYAYQMKDKNPLAFEQEMQTPMTQAYVAEMDKSGDEKKAMQASFQAWYGYKKYQTAYEKQFQFQILKNAAKREASGEKTVSLSNRDIAGFCRFQGETYISPDFFDRAESLSVSPAFKQEIQKTGDPSVAALPVRGEKSSVNPVVARQIASARGR